MPPTHRLVRLTLAGSLAFAIAMGVGRFAFTPLLPMMQQDGLVQIGGAAVLVGGHFIGYWIGGLLGGRLRVSPGKMLFFALFAIAAATLAMGLTDSFALWLAFRFLCGVCSAFTLVVVCNDIIGQLAEAGHVRMQSWVFSGVGAGIALAGLATLAFMAGGIGSAPAWRILGAASLAACVAAWLIAGREIPDTPPATDAQETARSPLAWEVVLAYGAAGLGYIIPATYLPVMAREAVASPLIFGWSWPLFGAAAFLSTLLSARLYATWSNRQVWAASQLAMASGLLLPVAWPHIITVAAAGICVGGTFMIVTMAGMKEAHRIAPVHGAQRHIVALTAAYATGQIVGPVFAGWIFEATGSFSPPLLVASAALALTAGTLRRPAAREEFVRR